MTVLIADPAVMAIPITDSGEPLVELTTWGLSYAGAGTGTGSSTFGGDTSDADDTDDTDGLRTPDHGSIAVAPLGSRVRHGVAARLARADAALPDGIRILVVEGLRSAQDQSAVITAYTRELRESFPDLPEHEVQRLSTRYVAPLEVAPHVAGAAVDLTLIDASGRPLWMGTDVDATPESSSGACAFAATNINAEARRNRTLLAEALTGAGLVNYPTEWWHWSYGDRYWAYVTGSERACYGPVPD